MSATTFNPLTAARELEAADAAAGADREALATKTDLAALEARLTWRLVGIAAAIVAAVKLIPGLD